jgi:hypothetical protein
MPSNIQNPDKSNALVNTSKKDENPAINKSSITIITMRPVRITV